MVVDVAVEVAALDQNRGCCLSSLRLSSVFSRWVSRSALVGPFGWRRSCVLCWPSSVGTLKHGAQSGHLACAIHCSVVAFIAVFTLELNRGVLEMNAKVRRASLVASVTAVLVSIGVIPASAGSISGYRSCSTDYLVAVSSETYSFATHTHKYTANSGTSMTRTSSPGRLSYGSIGNYKNASWTASNGLAEPMEAASSRCFFAG